MIFTLILYSLRLIKFQIQIALDSMENTLLEDPETRRYGGHIVSGVARVQDKLINALERNIDRCCS
jgi:hypothetical protein